MQLQKSIADFKALNLEILSVHREEKEGVAGLEKTAEKTAATFHLSSDLGSKSTGAYSTGGFHSYIVHRDGTLLAILKGEKFDRPTPEEILAKARAVIPGAGGAVGAQENWPSFRGVHAAGVRDGANLPEKFDATTGEGIRFKVEVPGLAHSSPAIWGERLFLTTAVSAKGSATFKPGLYGSGEAAKDRSVHEWQLHCLDKKTGKTLWKKTATTGRPKDKRHIKSTYANATPATDGVHVVAFFGSEGLFVYTVGGEFLWKMDLGRINAGAYDIPRYEWGTASSPIIYDGKVIVQCDQQEGSFLLAVDIKTGKKVWRVERDELPSWGTPTVYSDKDRPELIANGSNFIRGYDPATGRELWRLGGSSKITAPTPVFADGVIIVSSGRAPERPVFAIRPGARGDITLRGKATSNEHVLWSKTRRGGYMPTPLIYRGQVYILNNNGVLASYDLKTGAEVFYDRIPHRAHGFSASPVAADGKIYLSGEDGLVFVLEAGRKLNLRSTHSIGEPLMATPAISGGTMYLRGSRHLFAVGK